MGVRMTHILSVIIWLPIAAAFVLAFFPRSAANTIKTLGLFISLATFIISLTMLQQFQEGIAAFQLVESKAWIPQWGIRYALGVDGISLWLVLLTTLLTPVVFLSSWNTIHKHPKEYVISFLIMEAAMIGVFLATDLVLFYSFFELTLLPMYLVIGVWGGANRIYAAIKFFLFTITGSLLMLLGIIDLGFLQVHQTMTWSFAITDFYGLGLPLRTQSILFGAFALAFAIKVPLFPLHTWLPDAHVQAPTAGSVLLAGVLLKMGTYGMLRFNLGLFPDQSRANAWWVVILALIGIIYGGLLALVQPNMKKLIAYSSISHLGFVVLGIFSFTQAGLDGATFVMLAHGVSTGALFMLAGILYERRHTYEISELGGLATPMPVYATFFLFVVLASVGLPLLNGFVGEFLVLSGAFQARAVYGILGTTGVIWSAGYLLWMYQRVFFGKVTHEINQMLPDLDTRERIALLPAAAGALVMGVAPLLWLNAIDPAVQAALAPFAQTASKVVGQ
jgi:NADH-quinone oxidoreductase subunit M